MSGRIDELAHELRSPVAALTAIAAGFVAADTASRERMVELAREAVADIERLVADGATGPLRTESVDAFHLACDVVDAAVLAGINVRVDGAAGLRVEGDPERLRQALGNLVANADVHTPAGTKIVVSAYSEGGLVRLTVCDEGEGIAAEDHARIFERGGRLHPARPGSGLGLSVVRAIAEAHGGSVEVESAPGQGAVFTLALPLAASAGS